MDEISPLVRSSLDSLFHALEHNKLDSERDRRFTILHLDQAVELILKEKVKVIGKTIYKKDKTSISLYETKDILEKHTPPILISEWPNIDDLHQLRNDVEHMGRTPSTSENKFYADRTEKFMKRFCKDELDLDISQVKGLPIKENLPKYEQYVSEANIFFANNNMYNSLINFYIALELKLREKSGVPESNNSPIFQIINKMYNDNFLSPQQVEELKQIWFLRNKIVHGRTTIDTYEATKIINQIKIIIKQLDQQKTIEIPFDDFFKIVFKSDSEKVLALMYYLLKIHKIDKLTVNEIRYWLEKLRQQIPKNVNFYMIVLKKKGFIESSNEKRNKLISWYITSTGERYIEKLKA